MTNFLLLSHFNQILFFSDTNQCFRILYYYQNAVVIFEFYLKLQAQSTQLLNIYVVCFIEWHILVHNRQLIQIKMRKQSKKSSKAQEPQQERFVYDPTLIREYSVATGKFVGFPKYVDPRKLTPRFSDMLHYDSSEITVGTDSDDPSLYIKDEPDSDSKVEDAANLKPAANSKTNEKQQEKPQSRPPRPTQSTQQAKDATKTDSKPTRMVNIINQPQSDSPFYVPNVSEIKVKQSDRMSTKSNEEYLIELLKSEKSKLNSKKQSREREEEQQYQTAVIVLPQNKPKEKVEVKVKQQQKQDGSKNNKEPKEAKGRETSKSENIKENGDFNKNKGRIDNDESRKSVFRDKEGQKEKRVTINVQGKIKLPNQSISADFQHVLPPELRYYESNSKQQDTQEAEYKEDEPVIQHQKEQPVRQRQKEQPVRRQKEQPMQILDPPPQQKSQLPKKEQNKKQKKVEKRRPGSQESRKDSSQEEYIDQQGRRQKPQPMDIIYPKPEPKAATKKEQAGKNSKDGPRKDSKDSKRTQKPIGMSKSVQKASRSKSEPEPKKNKQVKSPKRKQALKNSSDSLESNNSLGKRQGKNIKKIKIERDAYSQRDVTKSNKHCKDNNMLLHEPRPQRNRVVPVKFWQNQKVLYSKTGLMIGTSKLSGPEFMTMLGFEHVPAEMISKVHFSKVAIKCQLQLPPHKIYYSTGLTDDKLKKVLKTPDQFEIITFDFFKKEGVDSRKHVQIQVDGWNYVHADPVPTISKGESFTLQNKHRQANCVVQICLQPKPKETAQNNRGRKN